MNNFQSLRKSKGWTMKEAAKQMGFPYTTYVNYEKGYRDPNTEALLRMSRCYGVTINYILGAANEGREDSLDFFMDMLQTRCEMKNLLSVIKDAPKEEIEAGVHFLKMLHRNEDWRREDISATA